MNIKSLLFVSLILISSSSAFAQVVRNCHSLHQPLDAHSASIYAMFYGEGVIRNTTTDRIEKKFVNRSDEVIPFVQKLETQGYKRRDEVAPGTVNVTRTDYMPVADYFLDGIKLAVKVRFRKYFTKPAEDRDGLNLTPIAKMKDRSKLEFKIDHPNFKGQAVNKQQLDILDSDINLIVYKKSFYENQAQIQQRLNEINPGREALVKKFMNAFNQRYMSNQSYKQGLFARTEYERSAFSLPLKSQKFSEEKMDAQITLDQNIKLTRLSDGKVFRPYKDSETVVENKVPIPLAQMTTEIVQDTPALRLVKTFVEFADQKHVEGYEKDAGKMSKMERKVEKQLRRAHEQDLAQEQMNPIDYE